MGTGVIFPISAIPFSILIMVLFFKKDHISNIETRIYKVLIVTNFIGLIIELLCTFASSIYESNQLLSDFIYKSYLVYLLTWTSFFTYYVYRVSKNVEFDLSLTLKKLIIFAGIVINFVVYLLPINVVIKNDFQIRYTTGLSVSFSYAVSGVLVLFILYVLFKNRKNIRQKKYIPVFVFFVVGTLSIVIQLCEPQILLLTYVETFICVIMYFTIENPDIKMLNEMSKNKELMEQGYEDKYNFLFEMTQEARNPLVNISNLSTALRMEDDPEKVKDGLLTLNNMVRQLDFSINNILNISSLDVSKVKVVNNKYELDKLCHDLEIRIKPEIKKTVTFNLTMPKQLPILFGDYMKLRQILYSLLINACKNTENGNINMKVNLIEKYDIARVIFYISDTGPGMPIEKINEILSATGSLNQQEIENLEKKEFNVQLCQKVVKIMGGNLMIKSNVGEGTEIVLTIDQRVYHEKDTSILTQYENAIANYRKVLIISQNKDKLGIIKKKLTDNHITYSSLYYGADGIDRIKSGKKFDFILVDDEMKEMSGFMTFKGMKEIKGFNTPVIIMLGEDKENIKDHYLDDGFSDYILLDNLENELDRIIEKY